jgi:hypothetical protein
MGVISAKSEYPRRQPELDPGKGRAMNIRIPTSAGHTSKLATGEKKAGSTPGRHDSARWFRASKLAGD